MVLSDVDIIERIGRGELVIEPYDESNVEPASVDLRVGNTFKVATGYGQSDEPLTLAQSADNIHWHETDGPVTLTDDNFVLATTLERVSVPNTLVAHVLGRSSLGRLGISVHQTAGYIDPGFDGQITLELSNHGPRAVELSPGDRICQIVFEELSSPALNEYGHDDSQYQGQRGPTASRMRFD